MRDLFSVIGSFIRGHVWLAAAGGFVLIGILVLMLIRFSALMRTALRMLEHGERDQESREAFRARLLARPALIDALIRRRGEEVIAYFGVSEHLVRRLERRKNADDARRLLRISPAEGSFAVFLAGMDNPAVAAVFTGWIGENSDISTVRAMGLSARGRDFSGEGARRLLGDVIEEVRELSGDPEWPVRFFSLRVLLGDDDPKSLRMVNEAFSDSHPLLRRTAAAEAAGDSHEDLFGRLKTMVLDDPVPEVRMSARNRIDREFAHRWRIDASGLSPLQLMHVLELSMIGSKEDENAALEALGGEGAEVQLSAARFLEKSGALKRLFTGANRGDREDWERRKNLLSRAVGAGTADFLPELQSSDAADVLLLAADLLESAGNPELIAPLAEKVFGRSNEKSDADESELYHKTVSLACTRGGEAARALVRNEIRRRRYDNDTLNFILPLLPPSEAPVFRDVLLGFLVDHEFTAENALRDIMGRLQPSMFLGTVLDILEADRSRHSHRVRLRALWILGGWHLDHTLQIILENLPVLTPEESRDFSVHLEGMNPDALEERTRFILASPDAGIRAAVIAALPQSLISSFRKEIREGLRDANPHVRIAALRALADAGEFKASGASLALLHDPVEEVRSAAARIAGLKAGERFLESLEKLLYDENESPVVRSAALEGLSASETKESLDALVRFLDGREDLREQVRGALAAKTDRKSILALIEHFKDSEAVLRERIADVFAAMGEEGEDSLAAILREDIPSLKPLLADIFTRTGFIEILIRRLGHRKPRIRRDAAELLAAAATESAYRGIVLAARDPDAEVRVRVTRALESLSGSQGESILQSLETDPDRRVRRYTQWAMERIRAKKLP